MCSAKYNQKSEPFSHWILVDLWRLEHTCIKYIKDESAQHLICEVDRFAKGLIFLHLLQDEPIQKTLRVLWVQLLLQIIF